MRNRPRSCGFIIFCRSPATKFLLLKHEDRWDLPKGHVDPGESDLQTAFRELAEETGIGQEELVLDREFVFRHFYPIRNESAEDGAAEPGWMTKELVVFLGYVDCEREIQLTEHNDYQWLSWRPPHKIQNQTIDPLLRSVAEHLGG
ncbi:MAG: NUDIX domain-containing protein [Pirellulaceae bacterium]|nr:NUDIX domain-containing protein [Pirellulaceae bacterium]